MGIPKNLDFVETKVMRVKDGPNSGLLIFQNGIVHLGLNPKTSFRMDTGSYYTWGLAKESNIKEKITILTSYPRNSGDPFMPIYDLDSISIDVKNLTLYEYGSRSSSFIKIDTIEYPFPVKSVLLYKKIIENSKKKHQ